MDPIAIRLPDADGGRPGRVVANPRPTPIPSCPGRATIGAVRLFPKIGLGVSVAGWHRARRARGFMAAEFDGWAIARQRIAKEARERTGAGFERARVGENSVGGCGAHAFAGD